jgi:hypothetical protein
VLAGAAAALAAVMVAAATVVMIMMRDDPPAGPDPYAGSYPVVDATSLPSPGITWQPSAPPAGPLKRFGGRSAAVTGTIVDRQAKLSYARLGPPWKPISGFGTHSGGMEWTVEKPKFAWWAGAYSDTLDEDFVTAAKGPNGLRAAAELDARKWAETYNGTLIPIAGQPLKVSGRNAWLVGYRVKTPLSPSNVKERALVVVVIDAGLTVPSVFEVSVAQPKYRMLPDLNTLVRSLRVVR